MERNLLADLNREFDQNPTLSPKSAGAVLSLITNPWTSDSTLDSLLETLILRLQIPNSDHRRILALILAFSQRHSRLRHRIGVSVREFILLASTPTSLIPHALSLLDADQFESLNLFSDESLFLSLSFFQCVKTRRWVLKNVTRFRVRPTLLLTVLIGFTKDPYPFVRESALDCLVMCKDNIVVEDLSVVERCYFRAVELLFDPENFVRRSAVRAVSEWGQLLVALNPDKTKLDLSDALFVQLCLMVRDMDVETRIAAFNALRKILIVSEDLLLQALSKKALAATKEKSFPGQYTAKVFKIPATSAAFSFVHGLEDEYYQVRRSACHAVQMLMVHSAKFSAGVVNILMEMLNDYSDVVRLQALHTLHHMAMRDLLKVEESHLDLFVWAFIDSYSSIRFVARRILQLTKLQKLAMFRSCIDNLMKSLELYPKDEADIFNAVYKLGRRHGKFVISIIREVSLELEPAFDGKLSFNKARSAALLVLAISAPVSFEKQTCSIPAQIYSYAVTMLGRLSCGLVDVMDQDTLLAYLSYCSRLTYDSTSKNFQGEILDLQLTNSSINMYEKSDEISCSPESMEFKKVHPLIQSNVQASSCMECVLKNVVNLWPLIQLGCIKEVQQTLRSWKEELRTFYCDSRQPAGIALKYLHIIKLLGKAWGCSFQRNICFKNIGGLEVLLGKMERKLKEMLCRYIGLSIEGKLHILELLLLMYTLRLSCGGIFCLQDYSKLKVVLRHIENLCKRGSIEVSHFVVELQNLSYGIGNSEDGAMHKLDALWNSIKLFSLKPIMFSDDLKYLDAEVEVFDPLPFIPGLPVGIPLDITLHNSSRETRLWLAITLGEKSTQFSFLDLHEFGDCNEIRKFKYIAPFLRTPEVKHLLLKISMVVECLSEYRHLNHCKAPKHELIYLFEAKEVHLSVAVK